MRSKRYQGGWLQWAIPAAVSLFSALSSKSSQQDTNEENVALGREQMAFQERMSGTAFQRATADMQAAGLNPMLAYSQGGASATAGSMPQVQNEVASGMSNAQQTASTMAAFQQLQQSRAQVENVQAATKKIESETMDQRLNTAMLAAQYYNQVNQNDLIRSQTLESGTRMDLNKEEAGKAYSARHLLDLQRWAETGSDGSKDTGFAADVRRRKAEARLRELDINEAEAGSKFYGSDMGVANPFLRQLLDVIRGLSSASRASRR